MKLLSIVLCLLLLTGCASTVMKLEQAEEAIETKVDAVEDAIETKAEPTAPLLTEEDAAAIAAECAGLTVSQITDLRVTYEVDDGVPEYEVEFRVDRMEYDCTVHADTGEVLSFEKDD